MSMAVFSGTPMSIAFSVVMPWMATTSSGMVQPSGRTMTSIEASRLRVVRSTSTAPACTMWGWPGDSDGSCQLTMPFVSKS